MNQQQSVPADSRIANQANGILIMIKKSFLFIAIASAMAMLFSCENKIATIKALDVADTLPMEVIYNINMIYSDSGIVKAKVVADLMQSVEDTNPRMEFPKGLKAFFYNKHGQVISVLKSKYGINHTRLGLIEVRDSVELFNKSKGEKLNTQKLIWDRRTHKIFTDVDIKITTPDKIIFGKGLEAEEDLSKRIIHNISGEILVEEERDSL